MNGGAWISHSYNVANLAERIEKQAGMDSEETFERGKVPFYCAAWSNLKSVKNAIRSGFRPGWVEVTAKSIEFVEEMINSKE